MFDIFYSDQYSVQEACNVCKTRYLWILDRCNDYSDFDFHWEPAPWEADQVHVWPSQHQENGGTYLIPKTPTENYNRAHQLIKRSKSVPRLHIKHNPTSQNAGDINTRYINDYLGTMRRALSKTDWEYCWVTSDVCDYSEFDFTWHPSEWQQDMLHVFASNEQKFGDTFYVHVPSFLEKTKNLKVLEWFKTLHFVEDVRVYRPLPEYVKYDSDTVVPAVWEHEFVNPMAIFYRHDLVWAPTVSLWQERTKTTVALIKGAETVLVPREAKNYLKTQIYDYPWINKKYTNILPSQNPIDIVFISNGESNAERNWQHLCKCTKNVSNRVVRVDGMKGRAEAYRAALQTSNTDWAFCVFAKLEVDPEFDWSWQPDRMQQSKHYIFHARNPINGLKYGHMAMIAYNKRLVLENKAQGLDFTLDQEHEVVPVLSGVARYADDPWIAWRSAFRECIKLKHSLPNIENEYRLTQWLTVNLQGDTTGDWSIQGAKDAVEYYNSVQGSFEALRLTYEWSWLADYLFKQHSLEPDQLCTLFQDR
jgi:hypothetical protein